MKTMLTSATRGLSLFLVVSAGLSLAEQRETAHFSGLLNDYSPAAVKGGPWEMHGQWTLDLHRERHSESFMADFYADMTMAGYGTTAGAPDGTKGGVGAHTHHIKLTNVPVTGNMDGCPTYSPATTQGFQINNVVSLITGNGGMAPFETSPPSSTLQVCVTGSDEVTFSNVSLVFGGPAVTHFGSQAIHGVVRKASAAPLNFVTSQSPLTLRNNYSGFVGMGITVGATPVSVVSLGRYAVSGNSGSHILKLVQADGTDVPNGSVTLSLTGATAGQYAFAALPATVTLAANTTYYLVSQETAGGDMWYDLESVSTTAVAQVTGPTYTDAGGHYVTVGGFAGYGYVPVSFQYQ